MPEHRRSSRCLASSVPPVLFSQFKHWGQDPSTSPVICAAIAAGRRRVWAGCAACVCWPSRVMIDELLALVQWLTVTSDNELITVINFAAKFLPHRLYRTPRSTTLCAVKTPRDGKQIDGDLMGIRIIYSIPCESILHLPSIAQLYS